MIEMKRQLLAFILLSPFLVCDPQPGVGITFFQLDGLWVTRFQGNPTR